MTQYGLTPQQEKLYNFLLNCIEIEKRVPCYEEMSRHMGLKSKSGISRLIVALEQRGRIARIPHHARAIKIMKPDDFLSYADKQFLLYAAGELKSWASGSVICDDDEVFLEKVSDYLYKVLGYKKED